METIELMVDGMTCGSCMQAASRALRHVPGVEAVDVRLQDRAATVRGEAVGSQADALVAALGAAGYPARVARGAAAAGVKKASAGCGGGRSQGGCCCGH